MANTHQPILPSGEESIWQALKRFLPPAAAYSFRHLTFGTAVRLRRRYLKWRGKKYRI